MFSQEDFFLYGFYIYRGRGLISLDCFLKPPNLFWLKLSEDKLP